MVLVASPGSAPVCFGRDTTALSVGFHLALKCERVRFVCFMLLPCILPLSHPAVPVWQVLASASLWVPLRAPMLPVEI